jgi:hypothetical protein
MPSIASPYPRSSSPQWRRSAPSAVVVAALVLTGLSAASGSAHAAPATPLDRVSISAGAFYAEPEIQLGANTDYGRIDTGVEKGSSVTLPRARIDMLIGDKHGVSADYFRYNKSYRAALQGDSVIDGQPVSGSASFDGKLQLDLAKVAYKWWLGEGNDVFGIGIGAGYYRAKVGGTATADVVGKVSGVDVTRTVTGSDSTSESAYAPLLELGWRHAFSPDLRMFVDASGVKRNGGTINGKIYSGAVGVEWFATPNVALVLDYGIQKIKLNRDSDRDANLNIKLSGPSAFVKVRF